MLLFCGCSKNTKNEMITDNYTCKFTSLDCEGIIYCSDNCVTFSALSVDGELLDLSVNVYTDKYTVSTSKNSADFTFDENDDFALAKLGKALININNSINDNEITFTNDGFIKSAKIDNTAEFQFSSHSKISD